MAVTEYPKRDSHFAHRFVRATMKTCLANEIGSVAVLMLNYVAHTEDAAHYRRPVTFYNEQLAAVLGVTVKSMIIARTKAVESGWLHHVPGGKGYAAKYWVTIPSHASGLDDMPTDEGDGPSTDLSPVKTTEEKTDKHHINTYPCKNYRGNGVEATEEMGRKLQGKGVTINPIPIPNPNKEGGGEIFLPEQLPSTAVDYYFNEHETKFLAVWNATKGTQRKTVMGGNQKRMFHLRLADPDWAENWPRALQKFPLPFWADRGGVGLTKFLEPQFVDMVLENAYAKEISRDGNRTLPPGALRAPEGKYDHLGG